MAKTEVSENSIRSLTESWLADPRNGKPYSGKAIRELLQGTLQELDTRRVGHFRIPSAKSSADSFYHLEGFASKAAMERYQSDPIANASLLLLDVPIPISTEQGDYYTARLAAQGDVSEPMVSTSGEISVSLRFNSILVSGSEQHNAGVSGVLTWQRANRGSDQWSTVGTEPIPPRALDSTVYDRFEVGGYLLDGEQQLRVRASFVMEDADGNKQTVTSTWVTWNSVTFTKLQLEYAGQWNLPMTGGEGKQLTLPYYIYGAVNKQLVIRLWGVTAMGARDYTEVILPIGSDTYTAVAGRTYSYTYTEPKNPSVRVMSHHGVHQIEAWVQVADDTSKQSEHVVTELMVVTDSSDVTPYIMIQNLKSHLTNYVSDDIVQFAIYNPARKDVDLQFSITDYAGSEEYLRYEVSNPDSSQVVTLTNTVEIAAADPASEPDKYDGYFRASMTVDGETHNALNGQQETIAIVVDNRDKYSPTPAPDFFMNPKNRNNSEANPERILNAAKDNQEVAARFENFGFQIDGHTVDDAGQRCLRVLAGRYLHIHGYEAFSQYIESGASTTSGNSQQSMTIELDFAVRNITNLDDAIFRMCTYMGDGLPLGLELKPLEGVFMTRSQRVFGQQNFGFYEGKRTHLAINLYYNLGGTATSAVKVSYVRVFIDGVIQREFTFDHDSRNEMWQDLGSGATSQGIRIGQDGADIDIYSLKVYKKALSAEDVKNDFVSSLPTAEEKKAVKEANAIVKNGLINYELAREKYDCVVWHGYNVSNHSAADKTEKSGWLGLWMHTDGVYDPTISGTICEATGDLYEKGQGSTAKHYYEWNPQWGFKNGDGTKSKGKWVDGNGTERGQYWTMDAEGNRMKKIVGKINYASSMQSHKQGLTSLYNDLHKLCVPQNLIMQENKLARCAVKERTVMYFVQTPNDPEPVYQGMMTIGQAKADDYAWGKNAEKYPLYCMMEGSENNNPLTDMRVPWTDDRVTYNPADELFSYNGDDQIDFDFGETEEVTERDGSKNDYPTQRQVEPYREAWNHAYRHNCLIRPWVGTLAQLKAALPKDADRHFAYWITQGATADGSAQFNLYRFNYTGKDESGSSTGEWVPAGDVCQGGVWQTVNLMTEHPIRSTSQWEDMNREWQNARAQAWVREAGQYWNLQSLIFHQTFIRLFAGTDNRSKNTYFVLAPYAAADGTIEWKIELHQDDLDTTLKTNNTGWQIKPYYILEHYRNAPSSQGGTTYWEGQYNVLFDLVERGLEDSMRSMMKTVLTRMASLVTTDDLQKGIEQSPEGCMEKYLFSIQRGIPAVAYNEQARIRYEQAQLAVENGSFEAPDNIQPISQSLGSQLDSERQYMKQRLVLMSSWAEYGIWDGDSTTGSLSTRGNTSADGTNGRFIVKLKPHQWLWPTGSQGGSTTRANVLVATGGYLVDDEGQIIESNDPGYVWQVAEMSGDTSVKLSGINYYRSIGNVGDFAIKEQSNGQGLVFTVSGERLTEFVAEPTTAQANFRPTSITVVAPNLRRLSVKGCGTIGSIPNLTRQTRLEEVDLRGTSVTSVVLPETETLKEVRLPGTLTELTLRNVPNLTTLDMDGTQQLREVHLMEGTTAIDSHSLVSNIYSGGAMLDGLSLRDVTWNNVTTGLVTWLTGIPRLEMTGQISMYESGLLPSVSFDLKCKIIKKWGNVDDVTAGDHRGLKMEYARRDFTSQTVVSIAGESYTHEAPADYQYSMSVNNNYVNGFTSIDWGYSWREGSAKTAVFTLSQDGLLHVERLSSRALQDFINVNLVIRTYDGKNYGMTTISKQVGLYDRPAEVGDIVYADGSYAPEVDNSKTAVGVAYLVPNEEDTKHIIFASEEKQTRFAVSLQNITATAQSSVIDGQAALSLTAWQFGPYQSTTDATNGLYTTSDSGAKALIYNEDGSSIYDAGVRKLTTRGLANQAGVTSDYVTDGTLRDEGSTDGLINAGFRPITNGNVFGDGFNYNPTSQASMENERRLTAELAVLTDGMYKEGDLVNDGYYRTLRQIYLRNKVLESEAFRRLGCRIPEAYGQTSELQDLANLMANIRRNMYYQGETVNYAKWSQVYFPASSACYAYEPTNLKEGETLSPKLRAHQWMLPAAGHLARLYWYHTRGYVEGTQNAIFAKAYQKLLTNGAHSFAQFSATWYWSSTEYSVISAWYVNFSSGNTSYGNEYGSAAVRAVAAF